MLKGNQDVRLCQTLCQLAGLSEMWTQDGPTPRAVDLMHAEGGTLSRSERTWFLLAWAVWNGDRQLVVADLLRLDARGQLLVGTLLGALAAGSQAVERWLREHEAS